MAIQELEPELLDGFRGEFGKRAVGLPTCCRMLTIVGIPKSRSATFPPVT